MLTASDSLEYDQSLLFGEENISGEKKKKEKKKKDLMLARRIELWDWAPRKAILFVRLIPLSAEINSFYTDFILLERRTSLKGKDGST